VHKAFAIKIRETSVLTETRQP